MRAGVPSARSSRSARTSGVGRHSRRMSRTSPGMSIHGSVDTSCAMSPIGNSGARSSGPTGSFVAGCSGGCNGAGRSGSALYQAVGSCDCGRSKRAMGVLLGSRRTTVGATSGRGEARADPRRGRAPRRRAARRTRPRPCGPRRPACGSRSRPPRSSPAGDARRAPPRRRGPRRRSPRSRALTPTMRGAQRHRPVDLVGVVRLDEHAEAEPGRELRRGPARGRRPGARRGSGGSASAPMARAS